MSDFIQNSDFVIDSVIEYVNIEFHNQSIELPLTIFEDPEYKFGIFNIAIKKEVPITKKHLHIFFTIDASGSMKEKCIDDRTKMENILFTIENILRIFHEKTECSCSIHVQSFDSKIYTIISEIDNIQSNDIETIISKINEIKPGDSTNIELALQSAEEQITAYQQHNLDHEIVHLFLTDGRITCGTCDTDLLKSIVPKDCANIFIGYGFEHDSHLLSLLSSEMGNEYRFIDALEKAGLVYGEIIHGILYKAITDVTIKARGCELYDYKTNTWNQELKIGNLISEQKKTYHIRSKIPSESGIWVLGKTNIEEVEVEHAYTSKIVEEDLTKYIFRQRTQELLYEAKSISEKRREENLNRIAALTRIMPLINRDRDREKADIEKMKTKLKTFLNLMVDYMSKNNIESDSIMKMLCDDIYITYKTIGTYMDNMFLSARQTSQGRQQSYTPSTIDIQENLDLDELPPRPPRLGFRRQIAICHNEDDADIKYKFSKTFLSPYSSLGVVNTMRKVSGNNAI